MIDKAHISVSETKDFPKSSCYKSHRHRKKATTDCLHVPCCDTVTWFGLAVALSNYVVDRFRDIEIKGFRDIGI